MALSLHAAGTIAYANSGDLALTLPTHSQFDVLIAHIIQGANVAPTMPAGWTKKYDFANGTACRYCCFWKYDNGSESNPTVTRAGGDAIAGWIESYSGVDNGWTDPFVDGQYQTGTGTGVITAPAITGCATGDLLIAVFCETQNDTSGNNAMHSTVTGWSETQDTNQAHGFINVYTAGMATDRLIYSGSSGSVTSTPTYQAGGTVNFIGIQMALISAAFETQEAYPDADNATGGWASTPLWSKIDEVSPDGTVITCTAA